MKTPLGDMGIGLGKIIALASLGAAAVVAVVAFTLEQRTADDSQARSPAPGQPKLWFERDMPGLWVADPRSKRATPDDTQERLESLGYLSGYTPASGDHGVTRYLSDEAVDGYNLVASGHAAEAILTDMNGRVLHRWSYDFEELPLPEAGATNAPWTQYDKQWKHHLRAVNLFENGDLLAIFDYLGLVKLDRNSELIWFYAGHAHHELKIFDERIYVLASEHRATPLLGRDPPLVEDFICVLDSEGNQLDKVSMFELFLASPEHVPALEHALATPYDSLHTNGIDVFDGPLSGGFFGAEVRRGDVLVSMRNNGLLAVVDLERRLFKSFASGPWAAQHTPRIQPDGTVMLFDNQGNGGYSRILMFEPSAGRTTWSYGADPPSDFYSQHCGYVQRLAQSHVLITESCGGRAFEVDMETQQIVWEYYNPHRAGAEEELIALLLEVKRIPADFDISWASG